MTYFPLTDYNFHDSHLAAYSIGPRREITLTILLDPVWNSDKPNQLEVRFSAIDNFEQVVQFFEGQFKQKDSSEALLDEISYLRKSAKNEFDIKFDNSGTILIKSGKADFKEIANP